MRIKNKKITLMKKNFLRSPIQEFLVSEKGPLKKRYTLRRRVALVAQAFTLLQIETPLQSSKKLAVSKHKAGVGIRPALNLFFSRNLNKLFLSSQVRLRTSTLARAFYEHLIENKLISNEVPVEGLFKASRRQWFLTYKDCPKNYLSETLMDKLKTLMNSPSREIRLLLVCKEEVLLTQTDPSKRPTKSFNLHALILLTSRFTITNVKALDIDGMRSLVQLPLKQDEIATFMRTGKNFCEEKPLTLEPTIQSKPNKLKKDKDDAEASAEGLNDDLSTKPLANETLLELIQLPQNLFLKLPKSIIKLCLLEKAPVWWAAYTISTDFVNPLLAKNSEENPAEDLPERKVPTLATQNKLPTFFEPLDSDEENQKIIDNKLNKKTTEFQDKKTSQKQSKEDRLKESNLYNTFEGERELLQTNPLEIFKTVGAEPTKITGEGSYGFSFNAQPTTSISQDLQIDQASRRSRRKNSKSLESVEQIIKFDDKSPKETERMIESPANPLGHTSDNTNNLMKVRVNTNPFMKFKGNINPMAEIIAERRDSLVAALKKEEFIQDVNFPELKARVAMRKEIEKILASEVAAEQKTTFEMTSQIERIRKEEKKIISASLEAETPGEFAVNGEAFKHNNYSIWQQNKFHSAVIRIQDHIFLMRRYEGETPSPRSLAIKEDQDQIIKISKQGVKAYTADLKTLNSRFLSALMVVCNLHGKKLLVSIKIPLKRLEEKNYIEAEVIDLSEQANLSLKRSETLFKETEKAQAKPVARLDSETLNQKPKQKVFYLSKRRQEASKLSEIVQEITDLSKKELDSITWSETRTFVIEAIDVLLSFQEYLVKNQPYVGR